MKVILLHGFGENATVWGGFIKKLPAGHDYYSPDFSTAGHLKTIEDYATWLKSETDDKKWKEMVIIGHSMGGYIALEFAGKYPGSVKGLGLFHSTALADSDEKKKNRDKTAAFIEKHGSGEFISDFYPNMFSEEFRKNNKSFITEQKELFSKLPKEALIAATLAMRDRRDNRPVLKNIQVPVLQIIGGKDAFVPKDQAIEQTKLLQTPYTLLLDNIAHAGMFEAPEACAAFITEFLKSC